MDKTKLCFFLIILILIFGIALYIGGSDLFAKKVGNTDFKVPSGYHEGKSNDFGGFNINILFTVETILGAIFLIKFFYFQM